MSGFLRRITRSRPAEAGEPLQEGRAAETEGAAPKAETPPGGATTPGSPGAAATTERVDAGGLPGGGATSGGETTGSGTTGGATSGATGGDAGATTSSGAATSGAATTASGDATAVMTTDPNATTSTVPPARRSRWRLFRRRSKRRASTPPAPVLLADPNVPAGVELAEQPLRPPTGRRGRLRRRLRYLRRARELMLRDLGGLLYEVHRTGGGNIEAHATVVGAKVQRIVQLDAEAHAIEAALGAPRGEAVVFEPGVGGTCATCGELYGSDARFCANCGTAIGAVAPPKTAEHLSEPARTAFWRRAARPAARSDQEGDRGGAASEAPTPSGTPTAAESPAGGGPATTGADDAVATGGDERASDATSAQRPASGEQSATGGDERAPEPASGERPASGEQSATGGGDERAPDAASGERSATGGAAPTGGDERAPHAAEGGEPTPAEPAKPSDEDTPHERHGNQGNGRGGEQPSPPWSPLVSRERS
jgi:hypothetical protein